MSNNANPPLARFRSAELRLLVVLVIVGEIIGVIGGVAAHMLNEGDLFRILATGAATLFFGSLLGGVVGLVIAEFDRRRLQRAAQLQFITNVLTDLKDVYDSVDRGRTLIKAHKSAKTYGEEMRNFISSRVKLLQVIRALAVDERGKPIANIRKHVDTMEQYLSTLTVEFEKHYKDVSRQQSVYEARMKSAVEAAARSNAAQLDLPKNEPWEEISNFDGIKDFIGAGGGYSALFVKRLDSASELLRNAIRAEY
jgi:hypothetical protein